MRASSSRERLNSAEDPKIHPRPLATMKHRALTTFDAKVLSFCYSGSMVSWNRFCTLWLLKCGFSPREVGLMKSLSLVGKLIAQPLWAGKADVGAPSDVLACSVLASVATLEALRRGTRAGFLLRHEGIGARPHQALWAVAALRIARSASSAASPVADGMVLTLARDGNEAWGRQRFWGSASWGLGSLFVGALIDRVGLEAGIFGSTYAVGFLLLAVLYFRVRPRWPAPEEDDVETPLPTDVKKKAPRNLGAVVSHGLVALRRSQPLRLALGNACVFGTLVVVVDYILYMQLENELGVSRTTNGLATTIATFSTFPFFWHSNLLIRRYGHWRVLAGAQCILPFRLLLHSLVTKDNVSYLLPLAQLLHGPMFACWLSAAVELVATLAPPELVASSQSLLTMAYFTIGGCVGHLVWSAAFEAWGGRATYLVAACCSTIAALGFLAALPPHVRKRPTSPAVVPYPLVDDDVTPSNRQQP